MTRLTLLDATTATPASRAPLEAIQAAFGSTPNMFRAVAHSPAALHAMWGAFGALGGGALPASLTEQLAVAIADRNGCDYCLAAHTALGRKAGVTAEALAEAQAGVSRDPRTAAALTFALAIVDRRGRIDAADLEALHGAGFTDAEAVEIVAHVALNLYTNYFNNVFTTPVDFPRVRLRHAA